MAEIQGAAKAAPTLHPDFFVRKIRPGYAHDQYDYITYYDPPFVKPDAKPSHYEYRLHVARYEITLVHGSAVSEEAANALLDAYDPASWAKRQLSFPYSRARALLLEHLDDSQRFTFENYGYVDVPYEGLLYGTGTFRLAIWLHSQVLVFLLGEDGLPSASFCVYLQVQTHELNDDNILALMLCLRNDSSYFERNAVLNWRQDYR